MKRRSPVLLLLGTGTTQHFEPRLWIAVIAYRPGLLIADETYYPSRMGVLARYV